MTKYKPRFEKDFLFYYNNRHHFTFAGSLVPEPIFAEDGVDAKQAFWIFDSRGKISPCREPELLQELLICKKAINLQINMWAEGQEDCWIPISELLEVFIGSVPEWVELAIRNQIQKVLKKKYGVVK